MVKRREQADSRSGGWHRRSRRRQWWLCLGRGPRFSIQQVSILMSATDPNIGAIGWQRDIMVWAGDVLLGAEQVDEPSLAVEAEVVEVLSSASDEDEAVEAEVAEGADEPDEVVMSPGHRHMGSSGSGSVAMAADEAEAKSAEQANSTAMPWPQGLIAEVWDSSFGI